MIDKIVRHLLSEGKVVIHSPHYEAIIKRTTPELMDAIINSIFSSEYHPIVRKYFPEGTLGIADKDFYMVMRLGHKYKKGFRVPQDFRPPKVDRPMFGVYSLSITEHHKEADELFSFSKTIIVLAQSEIIPYPTDPYISNTLRHNKLSQPLPSAETITIARGSAILYIPIVAIETSLLHFYNNLALKNIPLLDTYIYISSTAIKRGSPEFYVEAREIASFVANSPSPSYKLVKKFGTALGILQKTYIQATIPKKLVKTYHLPTNKLNIPLFHIYKFTTYRNPEVIHTVHGRFNPEIWKLYKSGKLFTIIPKDVIKLRDPIIKQIVLYLFNHARINEKNNYKFVTLRVATLLKNTGLDEKVKKAISTNHHNRMYKKLTKAFEVAQQFFEIYLTPSYSNLTILMNATLHYKPKSSVLIHSNI